MTDPLGQLRAHFTGLRLGERLPAGNVYAGQDGTGAEVVVAALTGTAATDPGCAGRVRRRGVAAQHRRSARAGRRDLRRPARGPAVGGHPGPAREGRCRTPARRDPGDRDGSYTVDLAHFAAAEPGGPLRWMVGVYAESPVPTRADVQKVLNDIVGQSTR
jgi:hypothetical protein